jgi:UDP-glucose 4-epimerase
MKILVTGGTGYIGSFMVKRLLEDNNEVTVVDKFGKPEGDTLFSRVHMQLGDLGDRGFLTSLFDKGNFEAIIHFAGYIQVGESMQDAYKYFENNIAASLQLIDIARKHNVNKIVFSSSAAVYGNPVQIPIPEDHPKNPESPYGESKWMFERILYWFAKVHGLRSVSLRYFNACGATLDGSMGETHNPETHIIPNAIRSVLENRSFKLFGDDYDTPDGTCQRDYIHVLDLAEAHVLALKKLESDAGAFAYNVGTGKGYSNKEIVEMVKKVSGKEFTVEMAPRRSGDPSKLIADPTRIMNELHFTPKYSDLETIVKSAYAWHSKIEKNNE